MGNNFVCQCGHGVEASKALVPSITTIESKLGHKPTLDEIAEEARCERCTIRAGGKTSIFLEKEENIACTHEGCTNVRNRMFTTSATVLEKELGRKPTQEDYRSKAVCAYHARPVGWYQLDRVVYTFENPPQPAKPQPEKQKSRWISTPKASDLPQVKDKPRAKAKAKGASLEHIQESLATSLR